MHFLDEILRLQQLLNLTHAELLRMAQEIAGDTRIYRLHDLRPTQQYELLVLLETISGAKTVVAQVRTRAMMASCR